MIVLDDQTWMLSLGGKYPLDDELNSFGPGKGPIKYAVFSSPGAYVSLKNTNFGINPLEPWEPNKVLRYFQDKSARPSFERVRAATRIAVDSSMFSFLVGSSPAQGLENVN